LAATAVNGTLREVLFRAAVVAFVALACGISDAEAQQRMRRATASFQACDVPANCPEGSEIQKLYAAEPTIELVTMGIGSLAWERHGHIALCVRYQDRRKDICFNYGIGSFHKPVEMAWGFFRGTNSFWAGEQTIDHLIQIYAGRNRTVWAQPIPLDPAQKQKVIDALYRDTAPLAERRRMRPDGQNLYYAYDHFWDNCTTRVRDILDDASGGQLSTLKGVATDGKTFRDLARDGFWGMRGFLLITDVAMGRVTDREPDYWERMFLPQFLREGVEKKWGIKPIILYQRQPELERPELAGLDTKADTDGNGLADVEEDKEHQSGRVLMVFLLFLLVAPAIAARYFGRFQRSTLALAIIPQFILGGILWFLAIISPLPYVMWNESLLVLLPLDLLLLIMKPEKRKLYARARVAMLGLYVLLNLIGVMKQPILALVIWPLIPNFLVGFWKPEWSKQRDVPVAKADDKPAKKSDDKPAKKSA
jgi:hypothetical protein